MVVMLDMDGVVVDMVGGVLRYFGAELPAVRGDEAYDIVSTLGYTFGAKSFWGHFSRSWWAELAKTAEADMVVEMCVDAVGRDNVLFTTHPTHPACVEGKLEWVGRNFPGIPVVMHCGERPDKHLLAHPNALLIDDRTKNVNDFRAAGGQAFLFGRPWNEAWPMEWNNVPWLADTLERFVSLEGWL